MAGRLLGRAEPVRSYIEAYRKRMVATRVSVEVRSRRLRKSRPSAACSAATRRRFSFFWLLWRGAIRYGNTAALLMCVGAGRRQSLADHLSRVDPFEARVFVFHLALYYPKHVCNDGQVSGHISQSVRFAQELCSWGN